MKIDELIFLFRKLNESQQRFIIRTCENLILSNKLMEEGESYDKGSEKPIQ